MQNRKAVGRYVALVIVGGAAIFARFVLHADLRSLRSPEFGLLSLLVFAGQLLPITVHRKGDQDEIITSTPFTYALVLTVGPAPAMVAQALASVFADAVHRKAPWKAAFNAAQYTISLAACAASLGLQTPFPSASFHVGPRQLLPILVSGAVFFLVNNVVTGIGIALSQGIPVIGYLRHDLEFQMLTDGVLLALAPVVAVCGDRTLWLVPLLLLPLATIYKSTKVSLENVGLVGRLEQSLTELTELNRKNEHLALYDALTDLPNRTLFRDRAMDALVAARASGRKAGVIVIDLDRFKEINDTLGHHNGDVLLRQVGPRLKAVLREGDTIARLGGDEFAVLLPSVEAVSYAQATAERLRRALYQPFHVEDLILDVEASVGIALFPDHGRDADALLQRAELAMYVAKSHRDGSQVYTPEHDHYSAARLALLGELRRAIEERQLVLHYQPKADLATGRVTGVEALMRWRHPKRGLVPPAEFIPFAEHTSLIRPLTYYALDAGLAQCRRWRDLGLELSVAINLSVRNVLDLSLPQRVAKLLAKYRLPPHALELEITESVLMAEPTRALRVLGRLSQMGVGLALDDFGTGYSSLAYLRELPVDEIKIDRSFVMNMARDESDAKIVRSTIDLARNLGLRVVAEGVEDDATWARLADLECDIGQGYFLSRPVPAAELVRWWQAHTGTVRTAAAVSGAAG